MEQPQKIHPREAIAQIIDLFETIADDAARLAAARRKIFLAYVGEGFSQQEALELVKPHSGSMF